jgi:hypothetical protein
MAEITPASDEVLARWRVKAERDAAQHFPGLARLLARLDAAEARAHNAHLAVLEERKLVDAADGLAESRRIALDASALALRNAMERTLAAEARVRALEDEREQLALAICGGEDVPGYANAQTVETLVVFVEGERGAWRQSYEAAEARVREMKTRYGDKLADIKALRRRVLEEGHRANAAEARVRELESALRRARDDMDGWAAYASEYFHEKHDLAGDLAAIDAALDTGGQDG